MLILNCYVNFGADTNVFHCR